MAAWRILDGFLVAPLAGAWIEILEQLRAIHGILSLPSRERGLKSYGIGENGDKNQSLPSRERGLKFTMIENWMDNVSRR